eukprot:6221444-Ditylum_brightwellii.AAC.1
MAFHVLLLRVSILLGICDRSLHSSEVDCSMHQICLLLFCNAINDGEDDLSQKPVDLAIDQACNSSLDGVLNGHAV